METSPVTTSAPAASAPPPSAPATSAPAPATTSSTPTRPDGINPGFAKSVFDSFDAAESGSSDGVIDASSQEIPVAQTPEAVAAPALDPMLTPTEGLEGQEALPANIREALKNSGLDPKLQKHLADSEFIRRDLAKSGTPLPVLRQYIQDAPKYLAIAPSVEVLETMAETALVARNVHEGFTSNTPDGFKTFTAALLQSNPQAVVGWMGWMLGQTDGMVSGLKQHFGQEASDQLVGHLDTFVDQRVSNGIARMRQQGAAAKEKGDDEGAVWSEVADYMEQFFGLAPEAQKARQQSKPDPRDLKIQQLEGERKQQQTARVEAFHDNVFNQAGTALDGALKTYLADKCKGLPPALAQEIYDKIGGEQGALYRELLDNPHLKARAQAIEQKGRYDRNTFQALTDFYVGQGTRLMENVAAPIIKKFSEFAIPADAVRRQRLEATVARRDPGASGVPALNRQPANARPAPARTAAQSIFDEFDRQADSAR